jgi:hypothetical protein
MSASSWRAAVLNRLTRMKSSIPGAAIADMMATSAAAIMSSRIVKPRALRARRRAR